MAVAGLADLLQSWLILVSCVFSPLLGVALTHFFVVRRAWDRPVNTQAVIAVVGGVILAKITPPQYVASGVGMVSGSLIYLFSYAITRFSENRKW